MIIRTTQNRTVKQTFESYERALIHYFEKGGRLLIHRGFIEPEVGDRVTKDNTSTCAPEDTVDCTPFAAGYISDLDDVSLPEKKKPGTLKYLDDNGLRIESVFCTYLKSNAKIPGLTEDDMKVLRGAFLDVTLPDLSVVRGVGEETAERLELFCADQGLEDAEDVVDFVEHRGTLTDVRNVGSSIEDRIVKHLMEEE